MSYKVVVEVPSSLAGYRKSEKGAVLWLRGVLMLHTSSFNWIQRTKSYERVRASERRVDSPSKDIRTLEAVISDLNHVLNNLKEEEANSGRQK